MAHDPERIRRIVEQGSLKRNGNVCPLCGFNRYTGSKHPFAGIRGTTPSQTRWCTGKVVLPTIEPGKEYPWGCPKCGGISFLTQEQMEVSENLGCCDKCGEDRK